MAGKSKYTEEQLECLRQFYPKSDYEKIFTLFPDKTKRQIKDLAKYYGIKAENPGHRKDLVGKRYGKLVVKKLAYIDSKSVTFWHCVCDCGNETDVRTSQLTGKRATSCGCLRKEKGRMTRASKDYTGYSVGRLSVVERIPQYKGGRTYYKCRCECGNYIFVSGGNLAAGKTQSCGCIKKDLKRFWKESDRVHDTNRKDYVIYKHTAPNGKVYIGITHQDVFRRWQNGKGYSTQKKFYAAIKKYGWDSFSHEIIEDHLTEAEACEKEKYYIHFYKANSSRYGYNVTEGGDASANMVTPVIQYYMGEPVNFFESLSAAAIALHVSSSSMGIYANSKKDYEGYTFQTLEPIRIYDIPQEYYDLRDEQHLAMHEKIRQHAREVTISRNKSLTRGVCQYSLKGEFIKKYNSIAEAKAAISGTGSLSSVLSSKGAAKSAGGYLWKYDDGDYSDIEPVSGNKRFREILQISVDDMKKVAQYESIAEAERATGISSKQIVKACRYQHRTAGGFIWRYSDDENAFVREEKKKPKLRTKPINQYDLSGKYLRTYNSAVEAFSILGIKNDSISTLVRDDVPGKSLGGFMWRYDDGNHDDIAPYKKYGVAVEQIDLETLEVIEEFASLREAVAKTKISRANIIKVCKNERKSAGGYAWRYRT